ncbi:MAG: S9 family peptidase [Candidatus Tectomicrobia bacterium]|nr:S9 family peptidase [Candidatus Tectomicrobia bacterium]
MANTQIGFEQFMNIRSAIVPQFSPDGKRVAFLTDITGAYQLWSLDVQGGWPDQLTFFKEPLSGIWYSSTADRLVFGMDVGGNERVQFYLLSGNGEILTELTSSPSTIHQFGGWSPDGAQIAFSSNKRHAAFFDIYTMNVETKEEKVVFKHDGMNGVEAWTPDGQKLILSRNNTDLPNDNNLFLLDLKTGSISHLTIHEPIAFYSKVVCTPDGKGFFCLTDQGREFKGLAYLGFSSRKLTYVVEENWDIEDMALTRDGAKIAYTTNVDGYSTLTIRPIDPQGRLGIPLWIPEIPRGAISDLCWSPDGRKIAFTLDGARHLPDIWILDLFTGTLSQLTHSSRAGIPQPTFIEPELIRYSSFDGREIPSLFYFPAGAPRDGSVPVVIYVHGGPAGQTRPNLRSRYRVAPYLIHRGYALLATNVRGSTGYGKTYEHLDDVRLRMDSVKDLAYAVEWLKRSGVVAPDRIGIIGGSYGGFMVLSAITTYPDLWAAAVDMYGIANFQTFLQNTGPWRRKHRAAEYGDPERDADFLREISPIHAIDKITAPLMVIQGENDPRVPKSESDQVVKELQSRGRTVEYLVFDDEGHGLLKLQNQLKAFKEVVEFFDRHLKMGD